MSDTADTHDGRRRCVISVLLPVFNEGPYLAQCLESVLAQDGADIEICLSDNASSDDTWDIATRYSRLDPRVTLLRHQQPVDPFENLLSTLRLATGDYVYLLGGDDYLLPGFFAAALRHFEREPDLQAVIGRMRYFSDRDGSTLATLPPPGFEQGLNRPSPRAVHFLLRHINHDELVLGVFRRPGLVDIIGSLTPACQESTGIWLFWAAALRGNRRAQRVRIPADVYLMKRYEKPGEGTSGYSHSAWAVRRGARSLTRYRGSLAKALHFYRAGLFSLTDLLAVLLAPRFHSDYGFCGVGPVFGPLWILFAHPVLKLRSAARRRAAPR